MSFQKKLEFSKQSSNKNEVVQDDSKQSSNKNEVVPESSIKYIDDLDIEFSNLSIDKFQDNIDNIKQYNSDFFVYFWAEQIMKWLLDKGDQNVEYVVSIPYSDAQTKKDQSAVLKTSISLTSIHQIVKNVFEKYQDYVKIEMLKKGFKTNINGIQYFTMKKIAKMDLNKYKEKIEFPESSRSPSKSGGGSKTNPLSSGLNQYIHDKLATEGYDNDQIYKILKSFETRKKTVKLNDEKKKSSKKEEVVDN